MTERTVRLTPAPADRSHRSVVVFEQNAEGIRSGRLSTDLPVARAQVVAEQDLVGAAPAGLPRRIVVFRDGEAADGREFAPRIRYRDLEGSASQITVDTIDSERGSGSLWADSGRLDKILDAWAWVLPARVEAAWLKLHSTLLRDFHSRRLLTGRREVLLRAVERFLDRNGSMHGSLLVELLTDLWLWHVLEQARAVHGPDVRSPGNANAVASVRRYCAEHPAVSASSLWTGYLATLTDDRKSTAHHFERARRTDATDQFLTNFTLRGLNTYLAQPESTGIRRSTATDFVPVQSAGSTSNAAIVYAGDVKFFRRYFSRLYFYGRLLRRTALHFHVVGPADLVQQAFEDARALAVHTDRLAGDGRSGRVGLSTETLPAEVADPVTYYACARFVRFEELLTLHPGGLWVQDMDLVQSGAVEDFIKTLAGYDVGVVRSSAGFGCTPWKSVLAGNVWIANTAPARGFMRDVVEYMDANWSRTSAWMLDQNALRYASDHARQDTRLLNLSDLRLPLGQNSLASLIEA